MLRGGDYILPSFSTHLFIQFIPFLAVSYVEDELFGIWVVLHLLSRIGNAAAGVQLIIIRVAYDSVLIILELNHSCA